jgi:hypothetical protein
MATTTQSLCRTVVGHSVKFFVFLGKWLDSTFPAKYLCRATLRCCVQSSSKRDKTVVNRFFLFSFIASIGYLTELSHGFDDRRVSGNGGLTSPSKALIFNIGKHPLGAVVKPVLSISNESGNDLELRLKPSCGCTELSQKELIVKAGEPFTINPTIKFPGTEETLRIAVLCEDKLTGQEYQIAIKGEAICPFSAEPKVLSINSKSSENFSLKLIEHFGDIHISDVELLSKELFSLEASNGLDLTFSRNDPKAQLNNEFLVLRLFTSKGTENVLAIPVEPVGTVQMSPSVVSLKSSKAGSKAVVLLKGLEVPLEEGEVDVSLGDGKEVWNIVGSVTKIQMRSKGCYVLMLEFSDVFPADGFSTIGHGSFIRVSAKSGSWTCVAPVGAFF